MNYVVDIDALMECLELTKQCKINGEPYISLEIVREMINRFPKETVGDFFQNLEWFKNI